MPFVKAEKRLILGAFLNVVCVDFCAKNKRVDCYLCFLIRYIKINKRAEMVLFVLANAFMYIQSKLFCFLPQNKLKNVLKQTKEFIYIDNKKVQC